MTYAHCWQDVIYLVAILFSFYLPDYVGRRAILLLGAIVCCICLMVVAGLNASAGDELLSGAPAKGALALIFIWVRFHTRVTYVQLI